MSGREWLLLWLLSILWGGSFLFVEVGLRELPPFTLVLARVSLAALALNGFLLATGRNLPLRRAPWAAFFGMGALNNAIPFSLIFWGQTQIAGGLAAILNATTPLFTVLLAHRLTADEKLTVGRLTGVLLGLAGVATMMGIEALDGIRGTTLGQLACVAAAASYAFSGIFGRRFRRMGIAAPIAAAGQLTASSLMLLPVALIIDRPWALELPGTRVLAAVLALALLSTAIAYLIFFRLLAAAGAVNVLLVTLLIPPNAMLLGAVLLGERLGWTAYLGLALIALGLLAIDGRPVRWLTDRLASRARGQ